MEDRASIREWNSDDADLYQRALQLRVERRERIDEAGLDLAPVGLHRHMGLAHDFRYQFRVCLKHAFKQVEVFGKRVVKEPLGAAVVSAALAGKPVVSGNLVIRLVHISVKRTHPVRNIVH